MARPKRKADRSPDDRRVAAVVLKANLRYQRFSRLDAAQRSRRRSPRIEIRKDEKKIWMPTMISVADSTARRS